MSVLRLGLLGLRDTVVLPRHHRDALTSWVGTVVADCQRLVAYGQHFIRAAAQTRGAFPPGLPLSVGLLLQMLPLLLAAGGPDRLPVWLWASAKVTIVYVLKVFGHRVLVVAVDSAFLLRPVGVVSILNEERGKTREALGRKGGGEGGDTNKKNKIRIERARCISNVGLTINVAYMSGQRRDEAWGMKWSSEVLSWRTTRCNLTGGGAGPRALLLRAIIRLALVSIKFSHKWAQNSVNRLPRRDKGPECDCEIVWVFVFSFACACMCTIPVFSQSTWECEEIVVVWRVTGKGCTCQRCASAYVR